MSNISLCLNFSLIIIQIVLSYEKKEYTVGIGDAVSFLQPMFSMLSTEKIKGLIVLRVAWRVMG